MTTAKKELRLRLYRNRHYRPRKGRGGWGKGRGDRGKKETDACYVKTSVGSLYSLLPFRCFVVFQHFI